MKPFCITCGAKLILNRDQVPNYVWRCENNCDVLIDTGVSKDSSIAAYECTAIRNGNLYSGIYTRTISESWIAGVQTYMPQILHHFIECYWAPCYLSIYKNVVVPHLNNPGVLDYILKTDVIHTAPDSIIGATGATIYLELLHYLQKVESNVIKTYLEPVPDAQVVV